MTDAALVYTRTKEILAIEELVKSLDKIHAEYSSVIFTELSKEDSVFDETTLENTRAILSWKYELHDLAANRRGKLFSS